jgi:lipoate-protein ligase B
MQYWEGIIACGLAGYPLTSLAELLPAPSLEQVMDTVSQAFGQVFGYQILTE